MRHIYSTYKEHYKALIFLGLPIVIGQIGVIVLGFADTLMIGHHSTIELGAASFVNNVFNLAIIFSTGFSYGLTPIVGGLYGTRQYAPAGQALRNSLLANLMVALLLTVCMTVLYLNIERLGQPEELIPLIKPYYLVLLASLVFVMLFNGFKQFTDGITDTKTAMWILLGGNVLNIIGNYILIYGKLGLPELGLLGAGVSTLFSRIVMVIIFIIIFMRSPRFVRYKIGFFRYGMGAAVAVRVSNFKGQNDIINVRRSAYAGFHLMMTLGVVLSLIVFLCRNYLGGWFTDSQEVAAMVTSLIFPFLVYQFGDGLQITFANALRGISDVKLMMVIAFVAYFIISLPVGYFCGFVMGWGVVGVWMAFPFGLTSAGLMLWWRFHHMTKLPEPHPKT